MRKAESLGLKMVAGKAVPLWQEEEYFLVL